MRGVRCCGKNEANALNGAHRAVPLALAMVTKHLRRLFTFARRLTPKNMFRNQYDSDITTWSPQGRIYQIEYAMEAVKQGSAAVALKSKTHAVIATLKRATSELASYQKKIFKIDEHLGIAIAGLTADARVLSKYMRSECLNHKYVYGSALQAGRLVQAVADKSQVHTQRYGRRPYGVGLLVAAYDRTGAHVYETCPSGNAFDMHAQAIGARSQSARTYLERRFGQFADASLDQLIRHALLALRETLGGASAQAGQTPGTASADAPPAALTLKNVSIGVVGDGTPFRVLEGADLVPYLAAIEADLPAPAPAPAAPTAGVQAPMEQ